MKSRAPKQKGSLLVEILIALALFAGVALIIGQSLSAGFVAESDTHTREAARRIAEGEVSRLRSASDTSWNSLSGLTEGVNYSINSSGVIASGTAVSVVDGLTFNYGFTVRRAPRDIGGQYGDTLLPTSNASGTVALDRGSLLARVTVTAGILSPIVIDTLLSRWRNVVCGQSDWSATTTLSVRDCASEVAGASAKTNIQTGPTLQLCNGCK